MNFLIALFVFFVALLSFCAWKIWSQGLSWVTTKRWLLYIPVALVMIGTFVGGFFYAMSKEVSEEVVVKWMNILVTAVFVFGYAVREFWQLRKKWTFWCELAVLLLAHFTILQRLRWQTASYFWLLIVVGIPEMALVFFLLLMFQPNTRLSSEEHCK